MPIYLQLESAASRAVFAGLVNTMCAMDIEESAGTRRVTANPDGSDPKLAPAARDFFDTAAQIVQVVGRQLKFDGQVEMHMIGKKIAQDPFGDRSRTVTVEFGNGAYREMAPHAEYTRLSKALSEVDPSISTTLAVNSFDLFLDLASAMTNDSPALAKGSFDRTHPKGSVLTLEPDHKVEVKRK